MPIDTRGRRVLIAVVLLGLVAGIGSVAPAAASGEAPPLCLPCESGIEAAAAEETDITVDRSVLEIRLRRNGDARFHVRSTLVGEDIAVLRNDSDRVDAIGQRAVHDPEITGRRGFFAAERVQFESARLSGDVMHIRYSVEGVAERRPGGLVFVDLFHAGEHLYDYAVLVDRITVTGPNGTTLLNDPPRWRVGNDGRSVTSPSGESAPGNAYLVYGDSGDHTDPILAELYVALAVLGWAGPRLLHAVPFALLFGATVLVIPSPWCADYSPRRALRTTLSADRATALTILGIVVWLGLSLARAEWIGWIQLLGVPNLAEFTLGWMENLAAPTVPVLAMLLFASHAVAVAVDHPSRYRIGLVIAAFPVLALAPVAAVPDIWGPYGEPVYAFNRTVAIAGLLFGLLTWLACFHSIRRWGRFRST